MLETTWPRRVASFAAHWRQVDRQHLLFLATLPILLYLVLPPLFFLIRTSLLGGRSARSSGFSWEGYSAILSSPELGGLLGGTMVYALGSTSVALVLGGSMAWMVERTNTPFKELAYAGTFVSFAVPGILRVIGWIFILGPRTGLVNELSRTVLGAESTPFNIFSMGGMIFVEGMIWSTLVFLLMAIPFRSMDPSLEEAATTSGASPWRTLRQVTLRLGLPAILSVLLLTFVRAVQSFEVPLLLGIPAGIKVLTSEIYLKVQQSFLPDYRQASAYGIMSLAIVAGGLVMYAWVTREASRFHTITGKGFRPRVLDLGRWRFLTGGLLLFLVGIQFLPVAYLVWVSFLPSLGLSGDVLSRMSLKNFADVMGNPTIPTSLRNSLVVAIVSATGAVLISALAAWVIVRTRLGARWILDQLASIPLVFPGVVLGVAILQTYLVLPIPIYGTIWVLVVAYVTAFLPFAMRYCYPGLLQIHRELEESAYLSGAPWWRAFTQVLVPLLMPALFGAWVFIFLISVRELAIAALLYTSQSQVVATAMLDLWVNGAVPQVSAFGTIVALGSIFVALVAYRVSRRLGLQI